MTCGYKMPVLVIGTYSLLKNVCVDSVSAAFKSGVISNPKNLAPDDVEKIYQMCLK